MFTLTASLFLVTLPAMANPITPQQAEAVAANHNTGCVDSSKCSFQNAVSTKPIHRLRFYLVLMQPSQSAVVLAKTNGASQTSFTFPAVGLGVVGSALVVML